MTMPLKISSISVRGILWAPAITSHNQTRLCRLKLVELAAEKWEKKKNVSFSKIFKNSRAASLHNSFQYRLILRLEVGVQADDDGDASPVFGTLPQYLLYYSLLACARLPICLYNFVFSTFVWGVRSAGLLAACFLHVADLAPLLNLHIREV